MAARACVGCGFKVVDGKLATDGPEAYLGFENVGPFQVAAAINGTQGTTLNPVIFGEPATVVLSNPSDCRPALYDVSYRIVGRVSAQNNEGLQLFMFITGMTPGSVGSGGLDTTQSIDPDQRFGVTVDGSFTTTIQVPAGTMGSTFTVQPAYKGVLVQNGIIYDVFVEVSVVGHLV